MPFPFLFLALSLALGIFFASFLFLPTLSCVVALLFCLGCAWLFYVYRRDKLCFIFILLTTLFFGASLYSFSNRSYEENSLRKLKHAGYLDFYGRLSRSPDHGRENDFLFLKVEKVAYQNKVEEVRGNLRVSIPRSSEYATPLNLFVTDKIKVSARILPYKGFRNFKTPTLEAYLKSQKIHSRAFSKSLLLVQKLESGREYFPLRLISALRQKLQRQIEKHFLSSDTNSLSSQGAVLEALLLGERARMDPSVTLSLQNAGIFHLFAISGAHIAILSFFLFSFFKLLRVPQRLSYLLLIGFLLFFAFLVEGRPSVMRATIMTLIFLLGKLIWKKVNLINTISVAAFFLLLANPFNLFDLGFQLTFAATFSIIIFFPKIIKSLPKLPLRISEIFALSLTAQLGVLPLIASSFNRVTFSSLILNFVALPLVGIIMATGYIFLPFSFLSPTLAQHIAKGIKYLIDLLIMYSHSLDKVSMVSYRIPTPHKLTLLGYFLFLYLLAFPPKFKRQKLVLALCFLAFLGITITYPFPSLSKNLKLILIDVGQGESMLVEFPGQKKMLIDGGGFPEGSFDIGENVVSPFLWRKGIKKIHYLVLSHAHPDHLNGLIAVERNFKIGEYWEAFSPTRSQTYRELKRLIPESVPRKRLFRGDSRQEKDITIDVLHPERGNPYVGSADNEQSLVLRITYGKTSFLLTGDIGMDSEKAIIEHADDIKSQVLKSPHHGSRSSSSNAFLESVAPGIVVISVGEGNSYGFPNQDVLERYRALGAKVYRTDIQGAIEVSSDGRKISVRTAAFFSLPD